MSFRGLLKAFLIAGVVSAAGGSYARDGSPVRSEPPEPRIKAIETTLISDLTGPEATCDQHAVDVRGNDLGIMAEVGDRLFFLFGDTFGYDGTDYRGPSGANWRSNTFGSTASRDPRAGICIQDWRVGADGKAVAIVEGAHQPALTGADGEQTKIPTSMVAVGQRLYVEYMSIHGFEARGGAWQTNHAKWVYSDDLGKTWTQDPQTFGGPDSPFVELALTVQPGNGNAEGEYVYALGTPSGRYGPACCARVPKDRLLDFDAWEYYAGTAAADGRTQWSHRRTDAVPVIPAPVGEASILWDPSLERWLYTYLNEFTRQLELREAAAPFGPWSRPVTLTTAKAFPELYNAFMTPSFLRDDGRTLYFVMSTYHPYETHVMKALLRTE
ncbi:MAG TPA: DUF4185 domain-containing protein [Chthoniobacterales bacterium]